MLVRFSSSEIRSQWQTDTTPTYVNTMWFTSWGSHRDRGADEYIVAHTLRCRDVLLPANFNSRLSQTKHDTGVMYGRSDRYMFGGADDDTIEFGGNVGVFAGDVVAIVCMPHKTTVYIQTKFNQIHQFEVVGAFDRGRLVYMCKNQHGSLYNCSTLHYSNADDNIDIVLVGNRIITMGWSLHENISILQIEAGPPVASQKEYLSTDWRADWSEEKRIHIGFDLDQSSSFRAWLDEVIPQLSASKG